MASEIPWPVTLVLSLLKPHVTVTTLEHDIMSNFNLCFYALVTPIWFKNIPSASFQVRAGFSCSKEWSRQQGLQASEDSLRL